MPGGLLGGTSKLKSTLACSDAFVSPEPFRSDIPYRYDTWDRWALLPWRPPLARIYHSYIILLIRSIFY